MQWRTFSAALLLLVTSAVQVFAQARSFQLEAGDASVTLRDFARQARVSIVMDRLHVEGVQTSEVVGLMTPSDALSRMLEGTTLDFNHDLESGAYAVTRSEAPALDPTPPTQPTETENMNPPNRNWFRSLATAIVVGAGGAAGAQEVEQIQDQEEVIELSPFTVSADESQGYQATSTLAGTRIKTDIRDLGAAISVVTQEFMEDTGATTLEDLFQYTTSTEIGGLDGNYSAANLSSGGGRVDQDETRREPQAGGRIRGLARPNYTRNYFSTSIPIDRYNTGQITISRGPNSLLFGLGSAGGVVDAGLGLASIGKNTAKVQFRVDNNASLRTEFDLNRTLIKDRLALKVSGLYEDRQYRQNQANRETNRIYAAIDVLLRDAQRDAFIGDTKIRANVEYGDESGTPPDALPPSQAWDSFFFRPPDFRPYSGVDYRQGFDTLNDGWELWGTLDTRRTILPDGTIIPGYNELTTPLHSTSHIFTQLGLVYGTPGAGPTAIGGGNVGFQGWIPGGGGLPFTNPFVNTRSYNETDGSTGFKNFSLTNRDIFDYRENLITGSLQEIDKEFDSQMVSFEQELFGGRGGIEITYGEEYYRLDRFQPFGGGGRNLPLYIDTTEYLSDTTPNPNVGRAFLLAQGEIDEWRAVDRENSRITAFYNLDFSEFNDGLGKWLGRHTFTGLFQNEDRINTALQHGKYWGPAGDNDFKRDVWGRPGNANDASFAGQLVYFAYVSDDLRGVQYDDVRLYPANIQRVNDGDIFPIQYYDAQDKTYQNGTFSVNRYARRAGPTNIARTEVESEAFAWQSYLLNNNIVGLLGWRSDTIKTYQTSNFRPDAGNRTLDVENAFELNPEPSGVEEGDTFTWSVVGHLPQIWVDKMPISSLSVHYGESENFSAIRQRNNILNNPIDNPAGLTEEMGFSVGFAEDRWLLRLTRYETSQALQSISNDPSFGAINEITRALNAYQNAEDDGQPFEVHQAFEQGVQSYDDLYNRVLGLLPDYIQDIYNYSYEADEGEWDNDGQIQGLSATTDLVAEGYELELVGNPTRNWRVLLNVAQTETIRADTANETWDYINNHLAALDAAGLTNVNDSPSGIVTMGSRYRNQYFSPLLAQRARDGQVSQEQREWRVNLVNNYSFREGALRGFSVGGALRYQSAVTTGYETFLDEFGNQTPDLTKPFRGPEEFNGDAWISYNKKLTENIHWKIQLNLRNLIGDQSLIPIFTNPDGQDAVFRVPGERSWFLTNTFSF